MTARPRAPLFGLLLALVSSACQPAEEVAGASSRSEETTVAETEASPSPALDASAVAKDLRDLETALTPFDPTTPRGEQSAWFQRRRDLLERMMDVTPEHGAQALQRFAERPDALPAVRGGWLHVAAHNAPLEALPILEQLLLVFGEDLGLRTKAAELLPAASPARAIELLEPILLGQRGGVTYPPEDRLLGAWNEAALALDHDRVPTLASIAVDIRRAEAVRHAAVKLLGGVESDHGRQALEQLLVESTGNHMVRRYAVQSLVTSVEASKICPLLEQVRNNEADTQFQMFLDGTIRETCLD